MVRIEDKKENYAAGLDVIELLFEKFEYSTPIMIFCSKVEKGREMMKAREMNRHHVYKITNLVKYIRDFVNLEVINSLE